jgi:diguanylate cyclase (GGDEF)-like protein
MPVLVASSSAQTQTRGRFAPASQAGPELHSASEVRALGNGHQAIGGRVHFVGMVTAVSGYARSFFIQDSTAGVDVEQSDIEVHVGDRVDLSGVTGPGHFAPIVVATHVRILGTGALPPARRVVHADLMGGEQDSQRIEIEGVVRTVSSLNVYGKPELVLILDIGGGTVRVLLLDNGRGLSGNLVDATVRLQGVCISDFNERRQFVGAGLLVPSSSDLKILQPAVADPFSIPLSSIRNVLQFGRTRHRVRISGVVTYQDSGHFLYLQEDSDGIRIQTSSNLKIIPGQRVEAVGFPLMGDYSPVLSDGYIRVTGDQQPVTPAVIDASKVLDRPGEFTHVEFDQQLVQLQGKITDSRMQVGQRVWTLVSNGIVFDVLLPQTLGHADSGDDLRIGSVLRVTGICAVNVGFDRNPTSFSILLRSPQDIVVLKRGSWWTAGHLLVLSAALFSAIVLAAIWVSMLRIRVRQQTRIIVESEQKFRFLATHDGLTQLLNRNTVIAELTAVVDAAKDRSVDFSVLIVDLDHFKSINDTFGHPAGDTVLRECAGRLAGAIRKSDLIGRYGGEEFLIVLLGLKGALSVDACERVLLAVSESPVMLSDRGISVTCSIGVSAWSGGPSTAEHLIADADRALYRAKANGRNRVEYGAEDTSNVSLGLSA